MASGRKCASNWQNFIVLFLLKAISSDEAAGQVGVEKTYFHPQVSTMNIGQVGHTVTLHCEVENLGNNTVSWISMRDFKILTLGRITYTSDERFTVINTEGSNDWKLQILSPQLSDKGVYQCQVLTNPPIKFYTFLEVLDTKTSITQDSDLYLHTGNPINITCIVSHTPEIPAFLFWYHNDRIVNYDNSRAVVEIYRPSLHTVISQLSIINAQPDDSGNYTCGPANSNFQSILVHVRDEACGGNIISSTGVIHSPNYPKKYERSERCVWNITVPQNEQVVLTFQSFNVEEQDTCLFDYVKILDGHESSSPVLGKFCGQTIPEDVRSSGNKLRIEFKSNCESEFDGFFAEFRIGTCGGNILQDSGMLYSPNYPQYYGPNKDCTWDITVPEGKQVTLQFAEFDVYNSNRLYCDHEFLEVFDGHGPNSQRLGKFCGQKNPGIIHSSGNQMAVKFHSGYTEHWSSGFSASFTKADICGEDIVASQGFFGSPNFPENYGPAQRCVWRITVPGEKSTILLHFTSFDVEFQDIVEIYDGHEITLTSRLMRLCGQKANITTGITSNGNKMTIVFESDAAFQQKGFVAEFFEEKCGGEIISDDTGSIQSRNYPANYRNNELCIWNITVPEGFQVAFWFKKIDLEYNSECTYDFVEIRDGQEHTLLGKFCGDEKPRIIRSNSNQMSVTFVSDQNFSRLGFKAVFMKAVPRSAVQDSN